MNKTNHPITPLAERFAAKCSPPNKRGCVLWLGYRLPGGYGRISVGGKSGRLLIASRVAWELAHGPIPVGACVLHKCDEASCVNAEHLYLGSHYENVMDSVRRNRRKLKLTEADIPRIRLMLNSGRLHESIAEEFGVSRSLISQIRAGVRWRHVK